MRPDRGAVALFVVRLGKLCAIPAGLTEADVLSRVADYAELLCGELDGGAFTERSFAHVVAQCRFFPSYAELLDHLRGWWRENRPPLPALAAPAPVQPEWQPPSEEQRAAIARAVQTCTAVLAEAAARKSASARPGATAGPRRVLRYSDELLLAGYRKIAAEDGPGAGAAAVRVAMLERKLAGAFAGRPGGNDNSDAGGPGGRSNRHGGAA